MIEIVDGLPKNVVAFAVSGRLTMDDCREVLVPAVEKSLKHHEKIRLYYELNSRFPGSSWDDLDLGLEHLARCERVAIVTDIGWVRLTVKVLRFLIPSEIRVFATIQAEEGREWIKRQRGVRADPETAISGRRLRATKRRVRKPPRARTPRQLARNKNQSPVSNNGTIGLVETLTEFIGH